MNRGSFQPESYYLPVLLSRNLRSLYNIFMQGNRNRYFWEAADMEIPEPVYTFCLDHFDEIRDGIQARRSASGRLLDALVVENGGFLDWKEHSHISMKELWDMQETLWNPGYAAQDERQEFVWSYLGIHGLMGSNGALAGNAWDGTIFGKRPYAMNPAQEYVPLQRDLYIPMPNCLPNLDFTNLIVFIHFYELDQDLFISCIFQTLFARAGKYAPLLQFLHDAVLNDCGPEETRSRLEAFPIPEDIRDFCRRFFQSEDVSYETQADRLVKACMGSEIFPRESRPLLEELSNACFFYKEPTKIRKELL